MRAEIILENIGQYRGIKRYDINSGHITLFQGKNSLGKTIIIKSIGAALSNPIKSKNLIIEANKFGILPREEQDAPLVNFYEDYAKISINYDEKSIKATIYKNGKIEVSSTFKGDEIFLYSCMLLKNSRIQEYLASGNYDFSWIVEEMSNAGKYQELKQSIDSYIRLNDASLGSLEDLSKKIGIYIQNIETLTEKKSNLENEYKEVLDEKKNLDMSKVPEFQELEDLKSKKEKEIKTARQQLTAEQGKVDKAQQDLEKLESELKSTSSDIVKRQLELEAAENVIITLKEYNIVNLQESINNNLKLVPPLSEKLGRLKVFKELNNTYYQSRMESPECPLCGSKGKISKENVEERITQFSVQIKKVLNSKNQIEQDNEILENQIKEAGTLSQKERKRDILKDTVNSKITRKKNLNDQIKHQKSAVKLAEENPKDLKVQIKEIEDEISNISGRMEKVSLEYEELNEILKKETKFNKEIQEMEITIEKNKELIKENSSIKIFDIDIPIEKAEKVMNTLTVEFKVASKHITDKINEQKMGAGKRFNSTIKNVIEELNLENFEDIHINLKDFTLTVIKKGGKVQAPGSLGGAEKGIIGGILQVSCKQTYLPHIPFFVGDDIILEFDPDNQEKFMNYLKKIAQDEDMFIVMTKPSNDVEINQIEI